VQIMVDNSPVEFRGIADSCLEILMWQCHVTVLHQSSWQIIHTDDTIFNKFPRKDIIYTDDTVFKKFLRKDNRRRACLETVGINKYSFNF
jgi:hypothetical protein